MPFHRINSVTLVSLSRRLNRMNLMKGSINRINPVRANGSSLDSMMMYDDVCVGGNATVSEHGVSGSNKKLNSNFLRIMAETVP
jgi:hypothetical protein